MPECTREIRAKLVPARFSLCLVFAIVVLLHSSSKH
jgi:hypothetical protein